MDAPTLVTGQGRERLVLRAHRDDDVDDVLDLCTDPLMQVHTRVPVPYTDQHAQTFVRERATRWSSGVELSFAIDAVDTELDDDGGPEPGAHGDGRLRYAGNVAIRPIAGGGAEVGFALAPWARGRSVMSQALRTTLHWSFEALDLQVVHWQAQVGNWPSRRVAWACGFRFEGTVRGLLEAHGTRQDGWIASLVRGDPMAPAHPWLDVPTIVGQHVVLRPWREDDVPRVVEACRDPVSQRWLPYLPTPYTLADAQWYIRSREDEHAQGSAICWCVAAPDDDRCLGAISLMGLTPPTPRSEVGYWAHPDARGHGVMTEATRLVLRHAVLPEADGGLGLHRVTLRASPGNPASNRVAQRAGFRRAGLARHVDRLPDGTFDDLVLYDALPEDVVPPGDDGTA